MQRNYQHLFMETVAFLAMLGALAFPSLSSAGIVEGFTEPYRRIAVPSPEVGVITELKVTEGAQVRRGQTVARLNDSVLRASLEVARAAKDATGSVRAAEAEHDARTKLLESYKQLTAKGNASPREYERAVNEHLKSAARLQSAREELEVRRLEYERSKAMIDQRQIRSPINGFVIAIEKEAGEFVAPTDAVILHVVQLDTLKVVFSVPQKAAEAIQVGQTVPLVVGYEKAECKGIVEFVSPSADPQSGTVRIKVRIPNTEGQVKSGVVCHWELEGYSPGERVSLRNAFSR